MRILLADDQKDVRSGLKILIEQETEYNVVGEATELCDLLMQAQRIQPDMVLLDWELSNLRVADLIPVLRVLCPGLKIVALSVRPEARKSAIDAGVDAFVSKGDQPEKLLEAIDSIGSKDEKR